MDAKQWPDSETLLAISDQTRRVSEFIRDGLPTTAGKRPFGANALPGVVTELDRLTYLFYGRSLADYDADLQQAAMFGWWTSLAGWIVATPGPNEHPELEHCLDHLQVMHADYRGWDNPIPAHVDAIFNGVATLRVYFGQIVFHRSFWIREGEWLRDEIQARMIGLACSPDANLGPWFNGELCRAPLYLLRGPHLPALRDGPLPIPEEIKRCGTFDAPKTEGVPVEWLDELDHYAAKLSEAMGAAEAATNGHGSQAGDAPPAAVHSPDFRSVNWFGKAYSFTANQARVVKSLWLAWEQLTPDVGDETLLQAVDHEAPPSSLRNLFRNNSAWGTMIVEGGSKGSHQLAEPEKNLPQTPNTRVIRA